MLSPIAKEAAVGKHTQWTSHRGRMILLVNGAGLGEADLIVAYEERKGMVTVS